MGASRKVWLGVAVATVAGCARKEAADPAARLSATLQSILDSAFAASSGRVPGIIMRVDAPSLGLTWAGAVGSFNRASGEKLKPEHTVRMASNTKTYIAATILRLVEQGKVGLDSAIETHLAPASVEALRRGGYDTRAITVRHLLNHTSGIFDYAMSPQYASSVLADFSHRWTRDEQLRFAVDSGKPIGAPNEKYHYSDTGYILLGEIIERASGQPMGSAVRDLLSFERLGIRDTYFESLDSIPSGTPPRAHQYADTIDTYTLDPSHDLYGGGGLVSNVENMARFYRDLVRGSIFEKKETLEAMLAVTAQSEGRYGMGIGRSSIGDLVCYGHSGYWGTAVRHCPALDLTIAVAINRSPDSTAPMGGLVQQAISVVVAESSRQ